MELSDRFYSAPEVANILGVTLRSLYRYIRSGKIETFKTAGGRLRFTREAVYNFMGPKIQRSEVGSHLPAGEAGKSEIGSRKSELVEAKRVEPKVWGPAVTPKPVRRQETAPVKKVPVTTTSLYEEDDSVGAERALPEQGAEEVRAQRAAPLHYYSSIRDLRLLAQKIQKSCQNAHVPYALTGYAGMSLHKEMPAFSLIHIYINFDDLPFFENILQAHEVPNEDEANLGLLEVTDLNFWQQTETYKGFKVAVLPKLEQDLAEL